MSNNYGALQFLGIQLIGGFYFVLLLVMVVNICQQGQQEAPEQYY